MPSAKPFLHPLKTPKSATFPSELHDEILSSTSDAVKPELSSSTPITPPTAYTDFLKAYTPVFTSPASAGVTFPRFPLDNKSSSNSNSNKLAPPCLCHDILYVTASKCRKWFVYFQRADQVRNCCASAAYAQCWDSSFCQKGSKQSASVAHPSFINGLLSIDRLAAKRDNNSFAVFAVRLEVTLSRASAKRHHWETD